MVQTFRLNDGREIPAIGLGTYKGNAVFPDSDNTKAAKDGQVEQAVLDSIDAGYRFIDTALVYETEKEVGSAVRAKIAEGVVKREDLFIVTKLWCTSHQPDSVEAACRDSLEKLGMEYVDLYLMHWPMAFQEGGHLVPLDDKGEIIGSVVDFVDTYKAMEKLVTKKLVRSIGVSNFNSQQLKRLLEHATIKPVANEIEVHPYFNQKKLVALCHELDLVVIAHSPFASPDRPWKTDSNEKSILHDEVMSAIGKKYNKTAGQVALRYLVQRGTVPIPKSVTKSRIIQNFDIFNFSLSKEDMAAINALDENRRVCVFAEASKVAEFPFHIEY